MKENIHMFDLMDTLVWSPNLMKLFATENAELLARFKQDPKKYQRETATVADSYLADGRVELQVYADTVANLQRLRQQSKIAVLSNGKENTITRILDKTGLTSLVNEAFSLDQFEGRDKSEAELYRLVTQRLEGSGLYVASYTDDKDKYCLAAADSRIIPSVFQIVRTAELPQPKGNYKVIRSLEEVR